MARLVFGMNQSLDGYVDHMEFAPGPGTLSQLRRELDEGAAECGRLEYESWMRQLRSAQAVR